MLKSEARLIDSFIKRITDIDCELSSIVSDHQTEAEASPGFDSHDKNDDGTPICLPEDARPELDGVRVHLDEAVTELRSYLEGLDEAASPKCEHCKIIADTGIFEPHHCAEYPNSPWVSKYESRVRRLEAEGMTRSDAQAVADAEDEGDHDEDVRDMEKPGS